MSKFGMIAVVLTLLSVIASAKRMPPRRVPPVIADGIRYSPQGDGRHGYVVANIANNKELWKVAIFHQQINVWLEEDVQWVFITNLKLDGSLLLIRDEKARCYNLDIRTKRVRRQRCYALFAEDREH